MGDNLDTFESKLRDLLNSLSLEAPSNTPDFALARYLRNCLEAYNEAALIADGGCRLASVPDPVQRGTLHPNSNLRQPSGGQEGEVISPAARDGA